MKQDNSTISWDGIAEEWAKFSEKNDYRNHFIIPNTIGMMGDIKGKSILDLGCGEGGYARILANMGADVTGIDCSYKTIEIAKEKSVKEELNINYLVGNSSSLDEISDSKYDIVLSSMMLMDCEDFKGTIREIHRVLRKNGQLFMSILHPCFSGQGVGWKKDDLGVNFFKVDDYFSTAPWEEKISNAFSSTVLFRHRPLQDYFKILLYFNFKLVNFEEPIPNQEQINASNRMERLTRVPLFLFMEWEK